ncbi:hypothetical protein BLAT2472_20362 [Burkholderia latens]|nr:hypothetical protein BDI4_1200059 [Burkholderia diffusa]
MRWAKYSESQFMVSPPVNGH